MSGGPRGTLPKTATAAVVRAAAGRDPEAKLMGYLGTRPKVSTGELPVGATRILPRRAIPDEGFGSRGAAASLGAGHG